MQVGKTLTLWSGQARCETITGNAEYTFRVITHVAFPRMGNKFYNQNERFTLSQSEAFDLFGRKIQLNIDDRPMGVFTTQEEAESYAQQIGADTLGRIKYKKVNR